jgi:ClpP class serine protease
VVLTKERLHELGVTGVVFAGPDDGGSWRTTLAEAAGGGGAHGGGVGVITIEGCLEQRAQRGMCEAFVDGYDYIEERYDAAIAAYEAGEIGRVVTVINSLGGVGPSLFATAERVRQKLTTAGIPTLAVADEDCCSAAWVWALVSDKLYAPKAARVGSIGGAVIAKSIAGALAEQGIEIRIYRSGEQKMRPSGLEPFTEADDAQLQQRADESGATICEWTALRRGGAAKEYLALKGAVFSGEEAARRGLTDGLMTAHEVIQMALKDAEQADLAETAGLSPTADAGAIKARVMELKTIAAELPAVKAKLAESDSKLLKIEEGRRRETLASEASSKRSTFASEVVQLRTEGRLTPAAAAGLLGIEADKAKGIEAVAGHYDKHGEASARDTLAQLTSEKPIVPIGAKPGAIPVPSEAGALTAAQIEHAKSLGSTPEAYAAAVFPLKES